MEISSIGSAAQGFSMESMRPQGPPPGDEADRSEELASKIAENNDEDGDGLLSAEELGSEFGSEMIEAMDSDGDGLLSQTELQSGIQSDMEEAMAASVSGTTPSDESRTLMEQIHSLAGEDMPPPPQQSQADATEAYALAQESLSGTYATGQWLSEGLDLAV